MKRRISFVALIAIAALPTLSTAQSPALTGSARWADSVSHVIDAAMFSGDFTRFAAARTLIDRALVAFPNDPLLLHYKGYELYREVGMMRGQNKTSEIPAALDAARAALEKSSSLKPMAETHALLAAVLGNLIGADPSQGMTLGPMAQQEAGNAMALGPNNPRVWLVNGISSIFTPTEYGGGLPVAESQLTKAIDLFKTDHPAPPEPSWGRAEAYAWLGQVLQKENKPADALIAYNQALAIQPSYGWVKFVLIPSVKK